MTTATSHVPTISLAEDQRNKTRRPFILIGLCGPKLVGKTTVAEKLKARLDSNIVGSEILGFADPIRDSVHDFLSARGFSGPGIDAKDVPLGYDAVRWRDLCQFLGDHARSLQWDIYIRHLERRLEEVKKRGRSSAIIHDVRTELEAEWVRMQGGTIVHVSRWGVKHTNEHLTETPLNGSDLDLVLDIGEDIGEAIDHAVNHIRQIYS